MRKMKRWLSGVLALCLIMTMVPVTAHAKSENVDSNECNHIFYDDVYNPTCISGGYTRYYCINYSCYFA